VFLKSRQESKKYNFKHRVNNLTIFLICDSSTKQEGLNKRSEGWLKSFCWLYLHRECYIPVQHLLNCRFPSEKHT